MMHVIYLLTLLDSFKRSIRKIKVMAVIMLTQTSAITKFTPRINSRATNKMLELLNCLCFFSQVTPTIEIRLKNVLTLKKKTAAIRPVCA